MVYLVQSSGSNPPAFQAGRFSHSAANGEMSEYRRSAHAVFDIKYHVVWITKYRYKVLTWRVAERTRDLIRQTCESREVMIVRGAVSLDHTHMLLSAPADCTIETGAVRQGTNIAAVAGRVSGTSKALLGPTPLVENQKWDEDDQGFKITAPTKP